ncbi:MAG TPA: phosphoribosyltransferase family protein [Acidimicrobiales bacterium]|nr:phosphoribosyltransferase family protein [Acidimicrobiales bacterium]
MTRLKFHNRRAVVPFVVERLSVQLADDRIDLVTWAPTAPKRRRKRGFDQAEVLARALARKLGVPTRRCLVRLPGPAQTGRHRVERFEGPRFDARRGIAAAVDGRRVALVDDVATTGATLARAAEVLRAGGARSVTGVVVARTPRTHESSSLSRRRG